MPDVGCIFLSIIDPPAPVPSGAAWPCEVRAGHCDGHNGVSHDGACFKELFVRNMGLPLDLL